MIGAAVGLAALVFVGPERFVATVRDAVVGRRPA
ncbi:Uncharacterised protein [Tsukamurella paurometabola]|uniref:Uncharacterized protein n=1 Tax=Tsukamurella paurometabola TaxID=2061 RepID=A0A3P8JXH2_TSUPA|nr:Uncharacterised protein [Tsukamurella paurometabola]